MGTGTARVQLFNEDCLVALKKLADNSIDALVTDPPAGIGFMGKQWDLDKGGSKQWVRWMESVMRECLRVLKPGAHGLVWSLPRTSHWTGMACEWAGFEMRDCVYHLFGQGFPKSLDISKAIDKTAGFKRPIIGQRAESGPDFSDAQFKEQGSMMQTKSLAPRKSIDITSAASAASAAWAGWGSALKPAVEVWWLVQKPLSEDTVIANVLKWGTGALNIDACRVQAGTRPRFVKVPGGGNENATTLPGRGSAVADGETSLGRFPSHLLLSHSEDCKLLSGGSRGGSTTAGFQDEYVGGKVRKGVQRMGYPEQWECSPDCATRALDEQSGILKTSNGPKKRGGLGFNGGSGGENDAPRPANSGGASRFFYCAKISPGERNAGLADMPDQIMARSNGAKSGNNDGNASYGAEAKSGFDKIITVKNNHPTVKPGKLMAYLIRLITPPGGVVLDPFMGSGSTGRSAIADGFEFVGIEREAEYFTIAKARIDHAQAAVSKS